MSKFERFLSDDDVLTLAERSFSFDVEAHHKEIVWFAERLEQALYELEALQSQATEAYPCRIVETDFETGTVTLEMQGKYTVSSGQKYLCDVPLYKCPDFSCKGKLDSSNHIADMRKKVKENHIPDASKMVVPDGWHLVPIEPTDSMLASARYARQRDQADRSSTIYRAMLAAAPKYTGESK